MHCKNLMHPGEKVGITLPLGPPFPYSSVSSCWSDKVDLLSLLSKGPKARIPI